jgi:hypothetical protein
MAEQRATRRLHLLTDLERPDVFVGMSDASDRGPSPVVHTPLSESYCNHPSHAEGPAAS